MWLVLLTYQLAKILLVNGQNACPGQPTYRSPANSDIDVICGSQTVNLQILLCPLYFSGYNESLLALNAQHSKSQCRGTADWTANPPVVKFNFSITERAIADCSSTMTITEEVGSGMFAAYSNVQYVNISGMVCSEDQTAGTITYHLEAIYKFSCRYPLQYLVNNTKMSVTGTKVAIRDNNGSFISTLSMRLYSDRNFTTMMQIPPTGLELKTRIFVKVLASNLTSRFYVHLDRCWATTSLYPVNVSSYDLFVGCHRDGQTVITTNGEQQEARFSFEAFRFVQNTNAVISTYYVHCATRLCVNTICPTLSQNCTSNGLRRRRSGNNDQATDVSDEATVSSGPITMHIENGYVLTSGGTTGWLQFTYHQENNDAKQTAWSDTLVAVAVAAGIIGAICLSLVAFIVYQRFNSKAIFNKTSLYTQE